MKKLYILPILFAMLFSSCEDYLNVGSETELTSEQIYATDEGFHKALTGVYVGMGRYNLYGGELTWKMMDLLAHHYENISGNDYAYFHAHDYTHSTTRTAIENAWNGLYNLIYRCNDIIKHLEEKKAELHPVNYEMIKGEALALRAFLHFDLLRMFGHGDYRHRSTELSNVYTIPYVTTASKEITPQATYAEVFKNLKADLNEAAKLLWGENGENCNFTYNNTDKSTSEHFGAAEGNTENFWTYFDYDSKPRINYYAAKAILARVNMWEGTDEGYQAVLDFLEQEWEPAADDNTQDAWDWVSTSRFRSTYHDRILSQENLFHLHIMNLNDIIGISFKYQYGNNNSSLNQYEVLWLTQSMFQEIFEYNAGSNVGLGDYRANYLFTKSSKTQYLCLKLDQYDGENNYANGYGDKIPLITTPEFYYYAAEIYAERGELTNALDKLNTVRQRRGLTTPLADLDATQIKEEIIKEWRKEYINLGQLFFQYKRWNLEDVFGIEMNDKTYVLPFPESETITGGRDQFITEE